jgi:hypothetical protein
MDIKELVTTFPHRKHLKWFGYNNTNIIVNGELADGFVESFKVTKDYFNGKFEQYLTQFRNSPVRFIKTDLIYNYLNLLNEIGDSYFIFLISMQQTFWSVQ